MQKKAELLGDAENVCGQLYAIYESIHHLDATLATLGHTGNGQTYPRDKRPLGLLRAGKPTRLLLRYLRTAARQRRGAHAERFRVHQEDAYREQRVGASPGAGGRRGVGVPGSD